MHVQRRSMLMTAAAAGVLPARAGTASPDAAAQGPTASLGLPIVMRQVHLPASVAFAASGSRPQHQLKLDFGTDLGLALYGPAAKSWREAGRPLYGLTTSDAWFCLEQAAFDAGYRTVRLQRHEAGVSLEDAAAAGREMRQQARAASQWRPAQVRQVTPSGELLVSWLMVPREALGGLRV